jgi:hypothetical protein
MYGKTADCGWTFVPVQRPHRQTGGHERGTQAKAETRAESPGDSSGWLSCVSALQCLRVGLPAGPAEDNSRAYRTRTDRKFYLDMYGHTLDWKANEEAAQKLGDEIAKAVANAEKNSDNSDCLTAIKLKSFHSLKMEVFLNQIRYWLRGLDLNQRPLGYEPNELPDCSTPHLDSNNRSAQGQTAPGPSSFSAYSG